MTNLYKLDFIDNSILIQKKHYLIKRLVFYVTISIFFNLLLIGLSVACFIIYLDNGIYWTLLAKLIIILRVLLLIKFVTNKKIHIYKLRGNKDLSIMCQFQLSKHFNIYPSLAIWLLIGYIDFFTLRITSFINDMIKLILVEDTMKEQFFFYLLLDILYILEFFLSLYIIYTIGIKKGILNVINHYLPVNP